MVDWLSIAITGLAVNFFLTSSPNRVSPAQALGVVLAATETVNCLEFARAYSVRSLSRAGAQAAKVSIAWTMAFPCVAAIPGVTDESSELLSEPAALWFAANGAVLLLARCDGSPGSAKGWRGDTATSEHMRRRLEHDLYWRSVSSGAT